MTAGPHIRFYFATGTCIMDIFAQQFGGSWTQEKLEALGRYLAAYTKVMKNTAFQTEYIDAFAGCGTVDYGEGGTVSESLFADFFDGEAKGFLRGSTWRALNTDPPFQRYIFVEKKNANCEALKALTGQFPKLDVLIQPEDANPFLTRYCEQMPETKRAVVFLDPFGMEVDWMTIEAIAKTGKIDLWYLFPAGIAVLRLLRRDGIIDQANRDRLNRFFGTHEWEDAFYETIETADMLDGQVDERVRTANFSAIVEFFQDRLRQLFPSVAENPRVLYNSRHFPLYILCFAVSNPNRRAQEIAMGIADHILRMK